MKKDKPIALVTGGNRGLGFGTCRELGRLGYRVILTARQATSGEVKTKELQSEGLDVVFHPLNVDDPKSIENLFEFVSSNEGKLDSLVNNAAILIDKEKTDHQELLKNIQSTKEILTRTLTTNVLGPYLLCEVFGPFMKKQGHGTIVNVSSGAGQLSEMGYFMPTYSLSKTALNAVTRLYAALLGPQVIVNSVCPGWVRTDMGGYDAPRSIEEGVDTIVWAAMLPKGGPTGGFFRDRQPIAW